MRETRYCVSCGKTGIPLRHYRRMWLCKHHYMLLLEVEKQNRRAEEEEVKK